MHHPTNRTTHTRAFVTPDVEHWLERQIAQWVHHEGSSMFIAIGSEKVHIDSVYIVLISHSALTLTSKTNLHLPTCEWCLNEVCVNFSKRCNHIL